MLPRPVGRGEPLPRRRGAPPWASRLAPAGRWDAHAASLHHPLYRAPAPPSERVGVAYVLLVLWGIYVVLSPIYLFPSGNPQVADAFMVFLIALLFTGYFVPVVIHRDLYLVGGMFLCNVIIVNGIFWAIHQESRFIMSSAYFVYNLSVVVLVISLFRKFKDSFIAATSAALLVATAIEFAACLALPATWGGVRTVGTFNNPNQLGYWSLLAASCFLVLKGRERLGLAELAVLLPLGYLTTLSLSKGATVGFAFLLVAALFFQGVRSKRWSFALIGGALLAGATVASLQPERVQGFFSEGLPAQFADRFERDSADRTLVERNYDRLWNYPEYLIFGAGEGAYGRFTYLPGGTAQLEIHSSFANILFSYGVVGAVSFAALLFLIFRRALFRHLVFFLPICFYGLTHQGLRASLFWVFLGLVFAMSRYGNYAEAAAARKR